MSAEVENNKEVKEQRPKKPLKVVFKEKWQIGIKILELLICAICMGFIYDPASTAGLGKSHMLHVGVMYTAYTGYMVINCVLILGRMLGERIPFRTVALFAVIGSALFLITCILLTVDRLYLMKHYFYHPNMYLLTMMTTSIIFAFINVVVFAVDAMFTFIFCAICLTFAILFYGISDFVTVTKIILLTVSSAFLFITSIDVLAWCAHHHCIQPKMWIMIAIPAYFMFWLCAGFLLRLVVQRTPSWLKITTCLLNVITGFIYLFDYIWMAISCYCSKTKSGSSAKSPDRRTSEDKSRRSMSSRSAGTSLKSNTIAIDESGDSLHDPNKLPSFKNKLEEKHIPYYLSSQPNMSQTLETLPEKDSKSSMDSKKELEIKHAEDEEYKEDIKIFSADKIEHESIHTIKEITEENPQEKCGNTILKGTTSRLLHEHHIGSEGPDEHLLKPSASHKTAVSFHSIAESLQENPQQENPGPKSRESVFSSLVKLFSRSKLKKGSKESKLSRLPEDNKEDTSIIMQESRATYCAQAPATQDAVHHQYYQSPCCKCGRTHYQQHTTVSGSLARCCNPDCPASQNYDPPQRLPQSSALNVRQNSIESPQKLSKCTMANDVRNTSTDTACPPCREAANQQSDGTRRLSYQNSPALVSRENVSNGQRRFSNPSSRSLQKRTDVRDQSAGSHEPSRMTSIRLRTSREDEPVRTSICMRSQRNGSDEPVRTTSPNVRAQRDASVIYCGCNYQQKRNGLDDDYPSRAQYPQYPQSNAGNSTCGCCCECRDVGIETTPPERSSSLTDSLDRRENSASATPDSVDEEIMVSPSSETKEVSAVDRNSRGNGVCTCCACNDVRLYCADCCEPCHGQTLPEPMEFVSLSRESKTTTSQISVQNKIKQCHAEPICSLCHMSRLTEDKSVNTTPKKKRFCFGKKSK